MAQVLMPQKENKLGKVLQVAGGVAGGVLGSGGGPLGAAQGASTGASLGGLVGGAVEGSRPQTNAVQRRMGQGAPMPQAAPAEDPNKTLMDAQMALQNQPREVQQQYGPAIQAARLKLMRGQV